jgi:hypothetical protein
MSVLDGLRLSLPDVAELARVQRPVVSVWRRRYARTAQPFPEPVAVRAGAPRFRASDVVAWIEATGLGNNAAFAADVALRAVFDDAESRVGELERHDGLTALLAIKAYTSAPLGGLSNAEVLDLADELDPDDAYLYREVAALGGEVGRMCDLTDLAASAAYTPGAAVEALLGQRFRAHHGHLAASALHPAGLGIVAALVDALGPAGAVADPYPGPGDVLHAVLASPHHIDTPIAQVPAGDPARLVRRRLVAHGWDVEELGDDADPSRVVVAAVPAAGEPELDDVAVLGRIDDVVLELHPGQRAVVIGPASALVEAATPAVESARAALLRTDRLRSVVLLPPGLVVERPRQRLALWVLGDAHPSVAIADRWTMVADLTEHALAAGEALPRAVLEDLLTDVVASLGAPADVRAHAFRFSRFVRVPEILARGGSLATAGRHVVAGARDDGGAAAVRVRELAAGLPMRQDALLDGVAVERGAAHAVHRVPLGTLLDHGKVRRISGNRLGPHQVSTGSVGPDTTRVVGVPELLGDAAWGSRVVDTLAFVGTFTAARLTEPGDVVFCTAPYPAAAVDVDGFSVVQFPAQVLRVAPRAQPVEPPAQVEPVETVPRADPVLVPEVLAADVGAQAPGAKWWRAWEVRLVAASQADAVGRALREVRDAITAARRRIADLEMLAATLTDGVTAGVVRLRQDEHARSLVELVETTP